MIHDWLLLVQTTLRPMKAVIQRVASASVTVDGVVRAQTAPDKRGLLVLAGLEETDQPADLQWMAEKIANIRIFPDDADKMNLSVLDVGGTIILVPNFTLAGDAIKGRRPSFDRAMKPERSEGEFERFVAHVRALAPDVQTGVFRAHMEVRLLNDGPVTMLLDSALRARA